MIVRFLRSSSYNAFDWCEHKFFIDYVLGYHSPAGKKAVLGTLCHKVLEIFAGLRLAQQIGKDKYTDKQIQQEFSLYQPDLTIKISQAVFEKGQQTYSEHDWSEADLIKIVQWTTVVLDSEFNPLKLNIVAVEHYFDFEIQQDWAKYDYIVNNNGLTGYLGLKGSVDLIIRHAGGVLELIDYKTGRRLNWNTGKEKTPEDLRNDPQFLIYYYAASQIFPEQNEIFITVFYINDGGPISIPFSREDIPRAEDLLRKRFNEIKSTTKPKRILPSWKCTKLCPFFEKECNQFHYLINKIGIDKVTEKYTKDETFNEYGGGGGQL